MRRMMKSVLSVALIMSTATLYFSCTHVDTNEGASFKIGWLSPNLDGFSKTVSGMNRIAIIEAAGGEFAVAPMDHTPQSIVNGVRELIAQGCNGIIVMPSSNSVLPQIKQMCEDARVYWIISMRPVLDRDMKQLLESSDFYLGVVAENDEDTAYEVVRYLAENGIKNMATYSLSNLNAAIEARELGLRRAAEEYGIRIVAELRNVRTQEALAQSVSALLEASPELDAIFSMASVASGGAAAIPETISQSEQAGQVKFVTIDVDRHMAPYFDEGIIPIAAGGHMALNTCVVTSLLVNAVTGYPVSAGKPVSLTIPYSIIRSSEEILRITSLEETPLFSDEVIRELLLKKNAPDLSLMDYHDIIDAFLAGEWP